MRKTVEAFLRWSGRRNRRADGEDGLDWLGGMGRRLALVAGLPRAPAGAGFLHQASTSTGDELRQVNRGHLVTAPQAQIASWSSDHVFSLGRPGLTSA